MRPLDDVPARSTDYLSPEVAQLLDLARAELDRHINHEGSCQECGRPWPCEPACLAAFTLGGV
jgi:hypothetical protein